MKLKDLYSAENQLLKALPKMEDAANDPGLKTGGPTRAEPRSDPSRRGRTFPDEHGPR